MRKPAVPALIAAGLLHALVLATVAPGLPERVPMHFGGNGAVDDWGSRREALWTFGLIGAGLLALFLLLALCAPRIPVQFINLPAASKEWWTATPEREAELRRRIGADLGWIGAATILLISATTLDTARAAQQEDPGLGWLFFTSLAVYLVFVAGWCIYTLTARYRPDDA